ncbi:dienelactone hydrolase family protein [Porticoccus sp. W117]|uniref:dienelactone hydrolase family protein n=1 Tax=Porticoccus sp. W117 TaxID=3054777 RepID=UPI002597A93B|nr:dienelactone hydrolase family protein [Porticoccus sp. W117]MDM3871512.1 dienelactone hydrolase family protein [Porticoccus sp. W117]
MCDEQTEKDNEEFARNGGQLNRRDFSKLSAAAIAALMFPTAALGSGDHGFETLGSDDIVESDVDVPMADGNSDCYFVRPAKGKHPGVLMWPDIKGLRPAFKAMGKRLARAGYAVLVVNQFYRDAKAPVVGPGADYRDPDTRAFLRGMARKLTQDASMSDARDYIAFLDKQKVVDTSKKLGTAGYCMGGPLIMRTAAAAPERVGAAASFHTSSLVRDTPDSPHLLIPKSPAHVLHAIAENDDKRAPEAKNVLAAAYKAAGTPAEIEVYEGTLHGWCPPDSRVYNEKQAEKAWARLLALFQTALD